MISVPSQEATCGSAFFEWRTARFALLLIALICLHLFCNSPALASEHRISKGVQAPSGVVQIQKNTLVVGSEQDYPPFATGMTEATAGGFTVELWKAVADEADLNYTIRVLPFHQLLQEFKDGKIDVLINLAHSEERHRFADFTVPHVVVNGAIFVRKGESRIRTEEDLAGRSIIVLNADLAHDYAISKGWGAQLVLVDTAAAGFRLLASGKHDAMLIGKLAGMQTLQALKITNIEAVKAKAGFSQKFAFAVHEGQSELLGQINEGLAITKSNGVYGNLYEKWFGIYESQGINRGDLMRYIAVVATVLFLGGGYFFYRRQVERAKADEALRASEQRYLFLFKNNPMPMWVFAEASRKFLMVNDRAVEHYGFTHEEFSRMTLRDVRPVGSDLELDRVISNSPDGIVAVETRHKKKDGSLIDVAISTMPMRYGDISARIVLIQDITERKRNETALRESEERFRFMLENSPIAVRISNMNTCRVVFSNQRYAELIEVAPDKVLGINPKQYYANPQDYADVIERLGKGERVTNKLIKLVIAGDSAKLKWVLASYLKLEFQNEPAVLGWFYDISDRKEVEEQVQHLAHYDPLTDLPNRTLFADRLQQALAGAKRDKAHLALMFIDLDKFKPINDSLGHNIGDLLLQEVARRIHACLRESDTVARVGGDEFVVLLPEIDTEQDALGVAEKIRYVLNQSFEIQGHLLGISSSTGIAIYPEHGDQGDLLMKNADTAMYHAKAAGRDNVKFYHAGMQGVSI